MFFKVVLNTGNPTIENSVNQPKTTKNQTNKEKKLNKYEDKSSQEDLQHETLIL